MKVATPLKQENLVFYFEPDPLFGFTEGHVIENKNRNRQKEQKPFTD